ncbi:MAG: Xaa-Pro peptidase family protein [Deltaproteobacteria bacterium]|nr:Xaa-Pro peptidase family protein [Deltaproteobacteria bacterium]
MYRTTPGNEVRGRLADLRRKLAEAGVDAALIIQNADLFYYTGSIQQGILFVPAAGDPVYFVRRVYERAVEEAGVDRIERIRSSKDIPHLLSGRGVKLSTLGFEMDVLPVLAFNRYASLFEGVRPVDISAIVRESRAVKGPSEIEALRACGRRLARLLALARDIIRPGMTETELCGFLQGRAIAGGHTTITRMRAWNQEVGLGCVISGPDSAVPSYADFPTAGRGSCPYVPVGAGTRAFRENEPILVDTMWAQDGYLVDMARTYAIGTLPAKLEEAHGAAVRVLRAIEDAIRPGAVAGDLYEIGVATASRTPFVAHFMGAPGYNVNFIGHGLGIEVDEIPFVARESRTVLAPGMVLALEPKFVFPGEGAVGLENGYLVTGDGFEKLTPLADEVIPCPGGAGKGVR